MPSEYALLAFGRVGLFYAVRLLLLLAWTAVRPSAGERLAWTAAVRPDVYEMESPSRLPRASIMLNSCAYAGPASP
jgi:hypothetical protein